MPILAVIKLVLEFKKISWLPDSEATRLDWQISWLPDSEATRLDWQIPWLPDSEATRLDWQYPWLPESAATIGEQVDRPHHEGGVLE